VTNPKFQLDTMSNYKYFAWPIAILLIASSACVSLAQEKLRVDNETVAIVESPWVEQQLETKSDFRGLCVVDEKTVWASGTDGTIAYTTDGGETWNIRTVANDPAYDFRDIHAFDDATAIVISAGDPARILRTTNGGLRWKPAVAPNFRWRRELETAPLRIPTNYGVW